MERTRLGSPVFPLALLALAAAAAPAGAAPQAVDTPKTAVQVAHNGVHLFVARKGFGLETCQIDNSQTMAVLLRMDFDGSNKLGLIESCSAAIRDVAADTIHVYYVDSDADLKRQSVNGGPEEIIAFDVDGPIALDATHVYWVVDQGPGNDMVVRRWPKFGGGLPEDVASFANVDVSLNFGGIAVDDTHAYWTIGKQSVDAIDEPGQGAVMRAPKDGGAVQTLADTSDGIDHARGIAVDGTHVYWTELGSGRLRRIPKGGGAIDDYTPVDELIQAADVMVDDQYAFWTDTVSAVNGRLRRVLKNGDPTIVDLQLGVPLVNDIVLTDSFVYWAQSGGVYRSGVDDGGVQVDLALEQIEVTQGLQTLDPNRPRIRMVADKWTIVRASPTVDLAMTKDVNAELRGFRNGMELPGSPRNPITNGLVVALNSAGRDQPHRTFNFHVPKDWRSGDVTLRVVIDPGDAVPESDESNNTIEQLVTFLPKAPLCLVVSRVDTPGPEIPPLWDDRLVQQAELVLRLFPTSEIWGYQQSNVSRLGGGAFEIPEHDSELLARMAWRAFWTDDPDECQARGSTIHYVGALDEFTDTGGALGLGYVDGSEDALWFKESTAAAILSPIQQAIIFEKEFLLFTVPFGGSVLIHEVSHNRGRKHIDCGDPDDPDGNYPYNPCVLDDDSSELGHWMLDPRLMGTQWEDEAIFSGGVVADYMTYEDPAWVSDYTFNALFDSQASGESAGTSLAGAEEIWLLSLFGNPGDGTGEIGTVQRLETASLSAVKLAELEEMQATVATGGDWELVLLAGDQSELDRYTFGFEHTSFERDNGSGLSTVQLPVAVEPGTAEIVLRRLDADVATRAVSANPPTVQVLFPNGGEDLTEPFDVLWTSNDTDGDDLLHTVQYSPDFGATWQTIAVDVDGASHTVEPGSGLAGSFDGIVRVITTDGAHTAEDRSDGPFRLRDHEPRVHILRPGFEDIFAKASPIRLSGMAMDNEDGPVDERLLSWTLDGAAIGTGREVEVPGLNVGFHTATLQAADSAGNVATDTVRFRVECRFCNENPHRAHVVVLIDTSDPMRPYTHDLCKAIPDWMARLAELGVDVKHQVVAIDGPPLCATRRVADFDPDTAVDHPSDWAAAVESLSSELGWRGNSTRMIWLVTNQGPEDGSPVDEDDRASVERAIAAANARGVAVSPWLLPLERLGGDAVAELAQRIAEGTGGTSRTSSVGGRVVDVGAAIQEDQGRLGCEPEVGEIGPDGHVDESTRISIRGRNLWPGTLVRVGGLPATSVETSADGSVLTFDLPRGLEPGRRYPIVLLRVGTEKHRVGRALPLVPRSD